MDEVGDKICIDCPSGRFSSVGLTCDDCGAGSFAPDRVAPGPMTSTLFEREERDGWSRGPATSGEVASWS